MIFRFTEIKPAEGFVRAVKERFQLDGQVFDNEDAAQEHDPFPGGQIPPIAHIDRVDRARADKLKVEEQVEKFAEELGGTYLGT
jgi:hypothetical protein